MSAPLQGNTGKRKAEEPAPPKLSTAPKGDEPIEPETPSKKLKETKALPRTRRRVREEEGGPERETLADFEKLVLAARETRRGDDAQSTTYRYQPNRVEQLAAAAAELMGDGDTQATLAVGLLQGGRAVVYSQRGKPSLEAAIDAISNHLPGTWTEHNVTVLPSFGEKSGKHAEVAIWDKYAESETPLQQVGASQPCCVDCTGFLNLNGVAHSESDAPDHPGRPMWWDPELDALLSDNGARAPRKPTVTPPSWRKFDS